MSTFRDVCLFLLTFILVRGKSARLIPKEHRQQDPCTGRGRGREGVAFQSFGELCAKDLHSESMVHAREVAACSVSSAFPSRAPLHAVFWPGRKGERVGCCWGRAMGEGAGEVQGSS